MHLPHTKIERAREWETHTNANILNVYMNGILLQLKFLSAFDTV